MVTGVAITLLRELFRKEGWTTHLKVVHVRHYGDPNNKTHAYVVAIEDKEFGEKAKDFAFPPPVLSDENCFTGRDYVSDVVPKKYNRTDAGDKALPVRNNVPGALHKVAQYAPGQGPAMPLVPYPFPISLSPFSFSHFLFSFPVGLVQTLSHFHSKHYFQPISFFPISVSFSNFLLLSQFPFPFRSYEFFFPFFYLPNPMLFPL